MESSKRLPPEARREQIVQSALQVFIEKGYSATTTAELAKAAGISEVTLFRHFKSKQEIFLAGVEPILFDSLIHEPPQLNHSPGREDLTHMLYQRIKFLADHQGIIRLILNDYALRETEMNVVERMSKVLSERLHRYTLRIDEAWVIRLLMGAFLSFLYLPQEDDDSIRTYTEHLVSLIIERD